MMTLIEMKEGQVLVLDVSGEIDREAANTFLQRITKILDSGEQYLLIDFSEATYINSTGLSVLILAAKRLQSSGGKLIVVGVNDPIQKVLKISGLTSLLMVLPTRSEALACFPQ
jgi:anti-anti-sigma factor